MSMIDRLSDLPIGILPGSVPEAPAVPPPNSAAPRTPGPSPAGPLTGRQLALRVAADLRDMLWAIRKLVALQESATGTYLMQGSIAGGGTIGTTAAPMMAANANRKGLSVQNLGSSGNLTLGLGTTEPQVGTGITLLPGDSWDGRISGQMWRGSVSMIGGAAGVVYSFLEV